MDDEQRRPVLDRGARIGKFAFGENIAARFFRRAGKAHERRVADQRETVGGKQHGATHSGACATLPSKRMMRATKVGFCRAVNVSIAPRLIPARAKMVEAKRGDFAYGRVVAASDAR